MSARGEVTALPFEARGEERTYFEHCQQRRLVIQRCGACGQAVFYPRGACPHCFSLDLRWEDASGRGQVHTFTVERRGVAGYEGPVPYVVAIVELEEGVRLLSHVLAEPELIRIGMPVDVDFAPRGGVLVPVFVPAGGDSRAS